MFSDHKKREKELKEWGHRGTFYVPHSAPTQSSSQLLLLPNDNYETHHCLAQAGPRPMMFTVSIDTRCCKSQQQVSRLLSYLLVSEYV